MNESDRSDGTPSGAPETALRLLVRQARMLEHVLSAPLEETIEAFAGADVLVRDAAAAVECLPLVTFSPFGIGPSTAKESDRPGAAGSAGGATESAPQPGRATTAPSRRREDSAATGARASAHVPGLDRGMAAVREEGWGDIFGPRTTRRTGMQRGSGATPGLSGRPDLSAAAGRGPDALESLMADMPRMAQDALGRAKAGPPPPGIGASGWVPGTTSLEPPVFPLRSTGRKAEARGTAAPSAHAASGGSSTPSSATSGATPRLEELSAAARLRLFGDRADDPSLHRPAAGAPAIGASSPEGPSLLDALAFSRPARMEADGASPITAAGGGTARPTAAADRGGSPFTRVAGEGTEMLEALTRDLLAAPFRGAQAGSQGAAATSGPRPDSTSLDTFPAARGAHGDTSSRPAGPGFGSSQTSPARDASPSAQDAGSSPIAHGTGSSSHAYVRGVETRGGEADPSALADLINDVLIEQARLRGVDLT